MLSKHPKLLGNIAQFLDLGTITVAFYLTFVVRNLLLNAYPFGGEIVFQSFVYLLIIALPLWWTLLSISGSYGIQRLISFKTDFRRISIATLLGTVILITILYLLRWNQIPRSLLMVFMVVSYGLLLLERLCWRYILKRIRKRGRDHHRVLVVGTTDDAKGFVDSIQQHHDWGLHVVGFLDNNGKSIGSPFHNSIIIGKFNDLTEALHQHYVEEVVFAVKPAELESIKDMITICETEGVQARIISRFFNTIVSKAEAEVIHDIPVISYCPAPRNVWHLFLKRCLDIVISLIAIIISLPAFIILGALVRFTSKGPIFYRWQVIGLNKKPFTGYKFRTMVTNADELKKNLVLQNEMQGAAFKMKNDPRVTNIGRWLRKFSLDELPQLFSVLKGDMSLVGPHPPLQTELPKFENWQRRKLSVKPGLTCLWQINGRSHIQDFSTWVKMDLEYIDNWSLGLDFKILLKTIPAVVFGRGAY